ncbi:MAG: site-specific DNA-methyltransferase [Candidimonas sp.]|nr:MAG: site-specific DNA-methyltransferase [Candidimonas sp.]TAM24796.1 MAG: site-specific DNA-methyltransferase [Candidimonas sp.]
MAVNSQCLTDRFALYEGDCIEVMREMPPESIHLSVYSPPFGGLYNYSSNDRDLSNCKDYDEFFDHYAFVVQELSRITMRGRMSAVHCMDVPRSNSGTDSLIDFPGDIIRLHEREGWKYAGRHVIWKEPLAVRLRTMQKNLAHASLVADSIDCGVASADYLLLFRRDGKNPIPVAHPIGMLDYAGARKPPVDVIKYRGWTGKQTENRFSHWIWRQYASCMWDDIRIDRVLPYKPSRDVDDEKHVHPLQLDVIERCIMLRSNPGETVWTPFMGVGSEVYGAIINGRLGAGAELKGSYFKQSKKNLAAAVTGYRFGKNESAEFAFQDQEQTA